MIKSLHDLHMVLKSGVLIGNSYSWKREYKLQRWDASERSLESRTKTMSLTKKYRTESNKPLGRMKIFWPLWRREIWSGTAMSHDHQGLPKQSCKVKCKEQKARQAEEKMGRQHLRMDRIGSEWYSEKDGGPRKLESAGCQIICCAPTVIQTTR